jgi:hypothetical protein
MYLDQPLEGFKPWNVFSLNIVSILIADGYINLKETFKTKAEQWGFFSERLIRETFMKKTFD